MRSFNNFLKEATETSASRQAKLLGLVGDGHGGWYDAKGKFVAKTEKGKLKFYGQGGAKPQDDKPAQKKPAEAPAPVKRVKPVQQQQEKPKKTEGSQGIVLVFGRFNPPTVGHQKLLQAAQREAKRNNSDLKIYPSRTQDPKKNPLDPNIKVSVMRQMFPQHSENIVNDNANRTIFDVLKKAHNDGYTNVRIVAGDDRVKQFDKLSQNYNGQLYQFDNLETISSGAREDDSEGLEGYSASRMRLAAMEGDFKTFYKNLQSEVPAVDANTGEPIFEVDPNTGEELIDENGDPIEAMELSPLMTRKKATEYFIGLRKAMGVEDVKECWNIWEIAPKEDPENLREAYIKKEIFDVGTKVEDVTTGLVGRILRRGTNHLICVTENQIMFKSWIKDVSEAIVNGTTKSGVPADQRLVGTDAHFRYVQSLVPGSTWGIQFINKYKVRKS